MRVLTLKEPFASLIGEKIKTIETRSWRTNYRGELYIHASISKVPKNDERIQYLSNQIEGGFHYGTIFLKCNLVDCVLITQEFAHKVEQISMLNYLAGDYTVGRYAWMLEDVEYINPIPAKGHLSIWRYNE